MFAAEYFSGTLASVDLAVEGTLRSQSFALGAQPEASARRAGELFFHDGTVGFQQWQSCASLHPGDARVDGLNWDLLNDGMGNPKNTKSLLLSYETPPTTAVGVGRRHDFDALGHTLHSVQSSVRGACCRRG